MPSHGFYLGAVVALMGACACLAHRIWDFQCAKHRKCTNTIASPASSSTRGTFAFQRSLLIVFGLLMMADTLQADQLFKLYRHYGLAKEEIGVLFVASNAAGATLGVLFTALADISKVGTRNVCILNGIVCVWAYATMSHSASYHSLLFARVISGASSTVLVCVFEALLVTTFHTWPTQLPDNTIFTALTWLNAVGSLAPLIIHLGFTPSSSASSASLASSKSATIGSFLSSPFDRAAVFAMLAVVFVVRMWKRDSTRSEECTEKWTVGVCEVLPAAWLAMASDPRVWLLGVAQGLFEVVMVMLSLRSIPVLEAATSIDEHLHTGGLARLPVQLVAVCFALCTLLGTLSVSVLFQHIKSQDIGVNGMTLTMFSYPHNLVFIAPPLIGALSFTATLALFPTSQTMVFLGLCVFHMCAGVFLPTSAILRSRVITKDSVRATIMAILRVPLNVAVMLVAVDVSGLSLSGLSGYVLVLCAGVGLGQFILVRPGASFLLSTSAKPILSHEMLVGGMGTTAV